jgi:hypothetical protein
MGRCGGGSGAGAGGGALGGCALLTAALVISTLVIQGAGGTYILHTYGSPLRLVWWFPLSYRQFYQNYALGCSCSCSLPRSIFGGPSCRNRRAYLVYTSLVFFS